MILYHGTDEISARRILEEGIEVHAGKMHTDFGQGFYTTPDINMAQQWALRKGVFSRPAITSFLYDENDALEMRVRGFQEPDLIWAQFIANNRNGYKYIRRVRMQENNLNEQYDIVIGQIADGKVSDIMQALRTSGEEVDERIRVALTRKEYSFQYSFHTKEAVNLLKNGRLRLL